MPRTAVQKFVDSAVKEKDWARLNVLFMGGGSDKKYKRGEGGLATGCDASLVPLDEVIRWNFGKAEKITFVKMLLRHGASVNGLPGCRKSPLEVARETKQSEISRILSPDGARDERLQAEVSLSS